MVGSAKRTVSIPYTQYGPTHAQALKITPISNPKTRLSISFLFFPLSLLACLHLECSCIYGPAMLFRVGFIGKWRSNYVPFDQFLVFISNVVVDTEWVNCLTIGAHSATLPCAANQCIVQYTSRLIDYTSRLLAYTSRLFSLLVRLITFFSQNYTSRSFYSQNYTSRSKHVLVLFWY